MPSENNPQEQFTQERLRLLAKSVSPPRFTTLLSNFISWAKRAGLCMNRRMGVEMTLLRALAFHPKTVIDEIPTAPLAQTLPLASQPNQQQLKHRRLK